MSAYGNIRFCTPGEVCIGQIYQGEQPKRALACLQGAMYVGVVPCVGLLSQPRG
jgi:hypothetical protein